MELEHHISTTGSSAERTRIFVNNSQQHFETY